MSVDDDERAQGKFSYTSVRHISWVFRNMPQHRGVRAKTNVEYVQSTCSVRAKWERGYGPRSPGGGL